MRDKIHHTLRFVRWANDMTIHDLCAATGMSYGHVQSMEAGHRDVTIRYLEKVMPVFKLGLDQFFTLNKIMENRSTPEVVDLIIEGERVCRD